MNKIDVRKTALLIVDMQNAFIEQEGSMARMGEDIARTREPIPYIAQLLKKARAARMPIVHLRMILRKDFADAGLLGKVFPALRELGHCVEGSWDSHFVAELQPAPDEFVIDQRRPSGFFGTHLETSLRALGVDTLVVTGVATNLSVESTVRDAFFRDFQVIVPREATASFTPEMEAGALANFRMMFAKVVSVEEVLAQLPGG